MPRSSQVFVNSSFLAALKEKLTGEIVLELLYRVPRFLLGEAENRELSKLAGFVWDWSKTALLELCAHSPCKVL